MTDNSDNLEELRALILEAFSSAASEGRADWYQMRGSVLKNRLLDLTNRSFDESTYGAERFSDLVEQLSDVLVADHTAKPFIVELLDTQRPKIEAPTDADVPLAGLRIRPDLWNAIVDYSNADGWVWDEATRQAIPVDEDAEVEPSNLLPTLDHQALQAWRGEFASDHRDELGEKELSQIDEWAEKGLGTAALPMRLRRPWNNRMRDRVHATLVEYFKSQGEDVPPDLVVERRAKRPGDELRSFVLRCISLMDERELMDLRIPADVAMRASK